MKEVTDNESLYQQWRLIAEKACKDKRYIHSMYYYRMAEFMLLPDRTEKDLMYKNMQNMFNLGFPHVKKDKISHKHSFLSSVRLKSAKTKKTLVIHGGFDSYIEEFFLLAEQLADTEVNIILFEGEGQGESLKSGLYFNEKWEESVRTILDFYQLDDIILMGISWGGYFALRAAAYEKRIKHMICHGVLYDGLDVQQHFIKQPIRSILSLIYRLKFKELINKFVQNKMDKDQFADWGLTHGMYITETETPFDYFRAIEQHNLRWELKKIDQHVLLLTGEEDHYIPRWQYNYLKSNLPHAEVDSRMFTEKEGGEQHGQVGNYTIAINHIIKWIKDI